ncbi:MAG: LysR family transcriptional regulator [Angelakisella sp.]|nr:LysR family transcriptional regulator [Angelakisella sp.]
MTQKELLYISAIADAGTISKAAEQLFIAQPSLSRCLQKIEADLGVELFKRTPDGLKPTVAGECYLESAQKILKTYKEMECRISQIGDMRVGKLVIGTTTFLGTFALPQVLYTFHALYPNIEVTIVENVSMGIENELIRGNVDLGLIHTPIIDEALTFVTLAEERFLLAVPPCDPINDHFYVKDITGEKYLDIGLTANRDYILTHSSQRTRQIADAVLARAGIKPRVRFTTKSIQTATRLVNADLGFSLVPHSYCSLFSSDYLPRYYFIEPQYQPTWELAIGYSSDIPLSKAAMEFIRISKETIPYLYKADNI